VEVEELKTALQRLGCGMSDAQLDEVFADIDEDGNGIEIDEFVEALGTNEKMEVVVHPEEVTEAIHRAELELERVRQSYGYRVPRYRSGWFLEHARAVHPSVQQELVEELLPATREHVGRYGALPAMPGDYVNRWALMGGPRLPVPGGISSKALPVTHKRMRYPVPSRWMRPDTEPALRPRVEHNKLYRPRPRISKASGLVTPELRGHVWHHHDGMKRERLSKERAQRHFGEKVFTHVVDMTPDPDVQWQYADSQTDMGPHHSLWDQQQAAQAARDARFQSRTPLRGIRQPMQTMEGDRSWEHVVPSH